MNRHAKLAVLSMTIAATALWSGCVTNRTFEQAQQKSYSQHQQDQQHILELNIANRKLKQRIEEVETALQSTRDQLGRTEKEWKEVRDELLKLKIEKEQQPGKRRDRVAQEKSGDGPDDQIKQLRLDEARRRAKELLQQLQGMMEQF
jgi:peptidoglycan hydrolase CwlO-like protein